MYRNIRTLHNFDPPATSEEVQAASLQFVREVSGSTKPSLKNKDVFDRAVAEARRRGLGGTSVRNACRPLASC